MMIKNKTMKYGTLKCKTLKNIRMKIAELNGLEIDDKVCSFADNCITGTCPMCEMELERLEREINLKVAKGEQVFVEGIYEL